MLSRLLSNAADKTRTVLISEAALYAALGYAIVFVGIVFLIFVVWLVGKVMVKANGSPAERKIKPEPIQERAAENVTMSELSDEIPDETLAVITAAIMAYYQQTKPKCEFTVKRIKRI